MVSSYRKFVRMAAVPLAVLSMVAPALAQGTAPPIVVATTSDIGRPYTLIGGACKVIPYPEMTLATDPLAVAVKDANQWIYTAAKQLNADAFIGMSESFGDGDSHQKGHLLVCGTFVKYRTT